MDNKILIVVDVQNGFIKTFANADMVNKIINLAESDKFDKVIVTKFINYTGSMYEKCFNWSELKHLSKLNCVPHLKQLPMKHSLKQPITV